jgi:hypothetical protein
MNDEIKLTLKSFSLETRKSIFHVWNKSKQKMSRGVETLRKQSIQRKMFGVNDKQENDSKLCSLSHSIFTSDLMQILRKSLIAYRGKKRVADELHNHAKRKLAE